MVSDNGPQFTAAEFAKFLRFNGIKHICSAPYHPATNSRAEKFVQTLKKAILVGRGDSRSAQHKLASFLLHYRSTPHSVTGVPPSTLLNNRQLKTIMDFIEPDVAGYVQQKQSIQKRNYDSQAHARVFEVGDSVMVQVHHGNSVVWEPGRVVEKISSVSYVVEMDTDRHTQHCCHIDQLQKLVVGEAKVTEPVMDMSCESIDSVKTLVILMITLYLKLYP